MGSQVQYACYTEVASTAKYRLHCDYRYRTAIKHEKSVGSQFIDLGADGVLDIKAGFHWDGPSGPLPDWQQYMRASLVHDALYELFRMGILPDDDEYLDAADKHFRDILKEDGVEGGVADLFYRTIKSKPVRRYALTRAPMNLETVYYAGNPAKFNKIGCECP